MMEILQRMADSSPFSDKNEEDDKDRDEEDSLAGKLKDLDIG